MVLSSIDGTIRRQIRFGDVNLRPLGLTVSKLDKVVWNSVVTAGSASTLRALNTQGGSTMIVSFWDSILQDTICEDYEMTVPSAVGVNDFFTVKLPAATYT